MSKRCDAASPKQIFDTLCSIFCLPKVSSAGLSDFSLRTPKCQLSEFSFETETPSIARLVDLGVPEYRVKDILRGVLGQTFTIEEDNRRIYGRLVS
ncbi:GspE family protein [Pseudosulfitobacter pseudonitzschiae]|uniref:GspE family protein n=1 Tax=Pseudosulfitobacter pseudonitzschiae TaxID=1402135 RepID=UPI001AF3CD71|nr:GspE family protein [Pseudosulfitobacter pseudonitzschiae]MBM1813807.1 hypothetical protein [Pseudosulfitobacter pseudonitzschiae]MBM1830800.1 hypothetical protein [Pseudosulfitobacter pseudonitzschiae]MBM1835667.1 hypothetical protein [Pseudosulfitobacter pseudonitzschiae]MBM1840513.1 hypothetical protein [Pseudosulfitobacter pseudonitzschiae]MBM1845499.1 hypothetical protein [Pseudosulfitobacter pseudonitzschiae]